LAGEIREFCVDGIGDQERATMLTDTQLKNLKPTGKLYKLVDRDGLYVAVTPSGVVSFRYDYRLNGRRETLVLGQYGPEGLTLGEAREKLIEAKKEIAAGKSPAKEKQRSIQKSKAAKTFGEFSTSVAEGISHGGQYPGHEEICH
jgi:hypothetical protein